MAALVCLVTVGALIAGAAGLVLAPRPGAAGAQALPDAGPFRVGSELGEERAGFSGRPKVLVFASAEAPDWPAIAACLQSAAAAEAMGAFTGVLVDERAEPEVESVLRERDGLRVVVRSLSGGFLGGLKGGFACEELAALLRRIRAAAASDPEKSPIYASLLESPAAIDSLIDGGEAAQAEKWVGFLEELEGAASPAVQAARSRLAR
jgi:hypothetical protein